MTVCFKITALLINWRRKLPAIHFYSDTLDRFPSGVLCILSLQGVLNGLSPKLLSASDVTSTDRGVTDIPSVTDLCSSWRYAHTLRSSSWHSHESLYSKGHREEVSHPDPNPFYPATACALKIEFPQGVLMAAVFIAFWNWANWNFNSHWIWWIFCLFSVRGSFYSHVLYISTIFFIQFRIVLSLRNV